VEDYSVKIKNYTVGGFDIDEKLQTCNHEIVGWGFPFIGHVRLSKFPAAISISRIIILSVATYGGAEKKTLKPIGVVVLKKEIGKLPTVYNQLCLL
jgi:hypothetical protein